MQNKYNKVGVSKKYTPEVVSTQGSQNKKDKIITPDKYGKTQGGSPRNTSQMLLGCDSLAVFKHCVMTPTIV